MPTVTGMPRRVLAAVQASRQSLSAACSSCLGIHQFRVLAHTLLEAPHLVAQPRWEGSSLVSESAEPTPLATITAARTRALGRNQHHRHFRVGLDGEQAHHPITRVASRRAGVTPK